MSFEMKSNLNDRAMDEFLNNQTKRGTFFTYKTHLKWYLEFAQKNRHKKSLNWQIPNRQGKANFQALCVKQVIRIGKRSKGSEDKSVIAKLKQNSLTVWRMSDDKKDALTIVFSMGNFSEEEINEISDSFSKIAPIQQRFYVRMSAEVLPAVLIFSLGFVLGGIAEGFFRAIGSDIYQKAKEKVVDSLKGKEKPTLSFEMFYKDVKISISATTNNEDTLNKVFDTINKAKDLAVSELDKEETPEMTEIALGYDKDWRLIEGTNWKPMAKPRVVKFYEYNKETGKWELTRDWSDR